MGSLPRDSDQVGKKSGGLFLGCDTTTPYRRAFCCQLFFPKVGFSDAKVAEFSTTVIGVGGNWLDFVCVEDNNISCAPLLQLPSCEVPLSLLLFCTIIAHFFNLTLAHFLKLDLSLLFVVSPTCSCVQTDLLQQSLSLCRMRWVTYTNSAYYSDR